MEKPKHKILFYCDILMFRIGKKRCVKLYEQMQVLRLDSMKQFYISLS